MATKTDTNFKPDRALKPKKKIRKMVEDQPQIIVRTKETPTRRKKL